MDFYEWIVSVAETDDAENGRDFGSCVHAELDQSASVRRWRRS